MEFKNALYSRRSTRNFTDRKVTRAEIDEMLNAAVNAPSACNMQSWHFYAVTDAGIRAKFASEKIVAEWAATAPVIFVVCTDGEAIIERFGDRARELFIIQDTAAAAENLLLTAVDLGLGGCWMGSFNREKCVELLDIPASRQVVAIIPVGEPANEIPQRPRKPLGEVVTYIGEAADSPTAAEPAEKKPFKLNGAYLPGAVFDDLYLSGGSFNNINMEGVRFTDINMSKTFFGGLTLAQSYFGCVDLNEATFENPCFDGATFKNCSFKGVTFEGCEFDAKIIGKDGKETELK